MKKNLTILFSCLVLASFLVVPLVGVDDCDATPVTISPNGVTLYRNNGLTSQTFTSNIDVTWALVDVGDGNDLVVLSVNSSKSATVSVNTSNTKVGTMLLSGKSTTNSDDISYVAVYLAQNPTTPLPVFHFFVKINYDYTLPCYINSDEPQFPNTSELNTGTWIEGIGNDAATALEVACKAQSPEWEIFFGSLYSGWIDEFLGLGTYSATGGWIYWIQYHWEEPDTPDSDEGWVFNNTTLGYINNYSHIALYFNLSGSAPSVPIAIDGSLPLP